MILPPATIGILGGGQLGRMSAMAARHMGYRIAIFEPRSEACARPVADVHIAASYDDNNAIDRFIEAIDVCTIEFENVPPETLARIEGAGIPVNPSPHVLATCRDRLKEKAFLRNYGFPHVAFAPVNRPEDLPQAVNQTGLPAVLKTATLGYDGKGQQRLDEAAAIPAGQAMMEAAAVSCVLEAWCPFAGEGSVIVARNGSGAVATYGLIENLHTNHILDESIAPAQSFTRNTEAAARQIATGIAEAIGLRGLLAVEFFILKDGSPLVNELAPRPHNSGHLTIEAAATSQFAQHIRAVCGLPLGSTTLLCPARMTNVLGDAWEHGTPDWAAKLADHRAHLHLYDKGDPRPGRKMGHITRLAPLE